MKFLREGFWDMLKVLVYCIFLVLPGTLFVFMLFGVSSSVYADIHSPVSRFTNYGFAFLAGLSSLTFTFLRTLEKKENAIQYFDVRNAGLSFFISAIVFLFASFIRYGYENIDYVPAVKQLHLVHLMPLASVIIIELGLFLFCRGLLLLLPIICVTCFNKDKINAVVKLEKEQNGESPPD